MQQLVRYVYRPMTQTESIAPEIDVHFSQMSLYKQCCLLSRKCCHTTLSMLAVQFQWISFLNEQLAHARTFGIKIPTCDAIYLYHIPFPVYCCVVPCYLAIYAAAAAAIAADMRINFSLIITLLFPSFESRLSQFQLLFILSVYVDDNNLQSGKVDDVSPSICNLIKSIFHPCHTIRSHSHTQYIRHPHIGFCMLKKKIFTFCSNLQFRIRFICAVRRLKCHSIDQQVHRHQRRRLPPVCAIFVVV